MGGRKDLLFGLQKKIQHKSSKLLEIVIPYEPFEMGVNEQKKVFSNLLRYLYSVLEMFNSQKPSCSHLRFFDSTASNEFQH